MYLAIIGDLIHSKRVVNRKQLQEKIETALAKLNQKYEVFLVSPLTLTLGDEFQALLTIEVPVFQLIDDIRLALKPYAVRFGIGTGGILTEINPRISIGADGPAYWRARKAIQWVHSHNDYGQTQICFSSEKDDQDRVINVLIASSEAIRSSWRLSQMEVLDGLLALSQYQEDFSTQILSDQLQLTASALSKRIKGSHIRVYLRARAEAQLLMTGDQQREEVTR